MRAGRNVPPIGGDGEHVGGAPQCGHRHPPGVKGEGHVHHLKLGEKIIIYIIYLNIYYHIIYYIIIKIFIIILFII